jgi:putative flippase GtrA
MRVFIKSTATSLFTTALDYATLVGLVELAHMNVALATFLGTVVGSLSNFTINKYWAFDARHQPIGPQLPKFVAVQAGSSFWNTVIVWVLYRPFGVPYPIGKLIAAAAVYLGWNFPLNRAWVFKEARSTRA